MHVPLQFYLSYDALVLWVNMSIEDLDKVKTPQRKVILQEVNNISDCSIIECVFSDLKTLTFEYQYKLQTSSSMLNMC